MPPVLLYRMTQGTAGSKLWTSPRLTACVSLLGIGRDPSPRPWSFSTGTRDTEVIGWIGSKISTTWVMGFLPWIIVATAEVKGRPPKRGFTEMVKRLWDGSGNKGSSISYTSVSLSGARWRLRWRTGGPHLDWFFSQDSPLPRTWRGKPILICRSDCWWKTASTPSKRWRRFSVQSCLSTGSGTQSFLRNWSGTLRSYQWAQDVVPDSGGRSQRPLLGGRQDLSGRDPGIPATSSIGRAAKSRVKGICGQGNLNLAWKRFQRFSWNWSRLRTYSLVPIPLLPLLMLPSSSVGRIGINIYLTMDYSQIWLHQLIVAFQSWE